MKGGGTGKGSGKRPLPKEVGIDWSMKKGRIIPPKSHDGFESEKGKKRKKGIS